MSWRLVDESFISELNESPETRHEWLVLEPHPDFPGQWLVNGFDGGYQFDLREQIGSYRAVSPARLGPFLQGCEEYGYRVAFFEDPASILAEFEALNTEPAIELSSSMPGTVKGMLPFQIQGYNFL